MPALNTDNLVDDDISRESDLAPPSAGRDDTAASSLVSSHMPGLDVLRGIAILMVLAFHGFFFEVPGTPWVNPVARAVYHAAGTGWTGVNLFFALSGFLITGNLVDSRERPNFYARFYIRRALRILPVYFAILVLLSLTGLASMNFIACCLVFMANMPGILLRRAAFVGYGPLWSLAVEEQFYLIWPWLFRTLKRRGLMVLCLAMMVICPVLRGAAVAHVIRTGDTFSKTWMVGDNLAAGALLALVVRSSTIRRLTVVRAGWALVLVAATGLSVLQACGIETKTTVLGGTLGYSLVELLCVGVVIVALNLYRRRTLPRSLRWLVFFGDISYGLYLVHMLLEELYDRYWSIGLSSHPATAIWTRFILANGLAVLIAALSKRYFENPILRLKNRIPAAR